MPNGARIACGHVTSIGHQRGYRRRRAGHLAPHMTSEVVRCVFDVVCGVCTLTDKRNGCECEQSQCQLQLGYGRDDMKLSALCVLLCTFFVVALTDSGVEHGGIGVPSHLSSESESSTASDENAAVQLCIFVAYTTVAYVV